MAQREIWRPIFDGIYAVSNQGRVKRVLWHRALRGDGILRPSVTKHGKGYKLVTLTINGAKFYRTVHNLVAGAFLGACPPKHQINHKNGKHLDNRDSNLEYVTASENVRHAVRTGLQPSGADHYYAKITKAQARDIKRRYKAGGPWHPGNRRELASEFRLHFETITEIATGNHWTSR